MSNTTRAIIFIVFLGCAGLMLFGPSLFKSGPKELPPQNSIPVVDRPIQVEFYSPGCGICQEMKPGLMELQKKYEDKIEFLYINTDDLRNVQLSQEFQISGLPTFYWITTDRKILDYHEGYAPMKAVEDQLIELLRLHEQPVEPSNPHGQEPVPET